MNRGGAAGVRKRREIRTGNSNQKSSVGLSCFGFKGKKTVNVL